jgi:hypothetical protein
MTERWECLRPNKCAPANGPLCFSAHYRSAIRTRPSRSTLVASGGQLSLVLPSNMNPVTFTAILLTATSAFGAGYQFPSAASSDSPDGKWKLICESPLNGEDAGHHLLLVRKVDGKRVLRFAGLIAAVIRYGPQTVPTSPLQIGWRAICLMFSFARLPLPNQAGRLGSYLRDL